MIGREAHDIVVESPVTGGSPTPSAPLRRGPSVLDTMGAMEPRDLYGLPLERFTPERNALAKQLRSRKRREDASEVATLRKPSVEAWAVNQLVRTQRSELDALYEAGDRLVATQADLIAGRGDPSALREAVDAERTAVDRLTDRARGLLSLEGRGLTAAALEHVAATLHAAALDPDARAQVRDGCLRVGLRYIGLGTAAGPVSAAPARAPRPRRARRAGAQHDAQVEPTTAALAEREAAAEAEREVVAQAEREAAAKARHAAAVKAARQREADSREQMDRATAELQAAEGDRDDAATALADAEHTLAAARERARRAADEHRRAQAALDEL
jgi:hypothetical protein